MNSSTIANELIKNFGKLQSISTAVNDVSIDMLRLQSSLDQVSAFDDYKPCNLDSKAMQTLCWVAGAIY